MCFRLLPHAGLSSWSVAKPCSVTCGNRVQFLSRTCTNSVPNIAEDLALELVTWYPRRRKLIFIPYCNLQLTVVGQSGVGGLHALKLVELVLDNVHEAARDRLLFMAGNLALEVGWKDTCATSNLARVRIETFRGITD